MRNNHAVVVATRFLLILTLLCGGLYPLTITIFGQLLFPGRSNGSLVYIGGRPTGSELLAQKWSNPKYFHSRPSANGYATLTSAGSNFSPTSAALRDSIVHRRLRFQNENGLSMNTTIPVEMLCSSGSGLDPHISPAAAQMQVTRIATARRLSATQQHLLKKLIERKTEGRQFGILGGPRVNVLQLNLLLDNSKEFVTFK